MRRIPRRRRWHAVSDLLTEAHSRTRGRLMAAEIGVWQGATSAHLLHTFPDLTLLMIDPWTLDNGYAGFFFAGKKYRQRDFDLAKLQAEKVTAFAADRRRIMHSDGVAAAHLIAPGSLTLAFIDGDHRADYVHRDITTYWPLVRAGGCLCGHDFMNGHLPGELVEHAVTRWCAESNLTFSVDPFTMIWWVWKQP